jgi:hypothetical protein
VALFHSAEPDQRVGEGSPMYLWSRDAARRIAEVQPGARIIAILREPAAFLRSLHIHWVLHHIEKETDLRTAIGLEEARRRLPLDQIDSYWPPAVLYSDHVRYVEQLRRYHDLFGPERMLVLIYDDYRADNDATVRRVLRFLEVDDTVPIEAMEVKPTSVRVRSMRVDDMFRRMYLREGPWSRATSTTLKAVIPRQMRRTAVRALRHRLAYAAPEPLDETLALELRRRFKGEVVALSDYLGRDLVSLWGYEGIA